MISRTLLVIPNYNDSKRLEPFLNSLVGVLPGHFSILVSDDGSVAEEQSELTHLISTLGKSLSPDSPEVLPPLFAPNNTGKGGAVYRGWERAEEFSRIAFADADGSVSATEIVRAEEFFRSRNGLIDALFASRVKMLGRSIHRSFKRHLSGRIFATLVSELTKVPAYDTQCGFKILSTEVYRKIRPHLTTQGFAFDVELMLLLLKAKARIVEFPVDWHDVTGSKVHLFRDSLQMARQVFSIKRRVQSLDLQ